MVMSHVHYYHSLISVFPATFLSLFLMLNKSLLIIKILILFMLEKIVPLTKIVLVLSCLKPLPWFQLSFNEA